MRFPIVDELLRAVGTDNIFLSRPLMSLAGSHDKPGRPAINIKVSAKLIEAFALIKVRVLNMRKALPRDVEAEEFESLCRHFEQARRFFIGIGERKLLMRGH
jgi:hypothetical protein